MRKNMGKRLISFLLCLLLTVGLLPVPAQAAPAGRFVLAAETGSGLVIAPEYVSYTDGQTVKEALQASGHTFVGLEEGMVSSIDGVVGNYTRSDENGGYDLDQAASGVGFFRFSEASDSTPSAGLRELMTAMADYLEKEADVRAAAKEAYDTAFAQFVGIDSASASTLAVNLNRAVSGYEDALNGQTYEISFKDGDSAYSNTNYPGVSLSAENRYGKEWTDADGDGALELPAGTYTFRIAWNGLRAEGSLEISADAAVTAVLPETEWLKLDAFRLSGSYGADGSGENSFEDGAFTLGEWSDRRVTVPVTDTFTGAVYTYAEYDKALLSEVPSLTAIYTMASTGEVMEKVLAFESKTSGAYSVLAKGAEGNTVIYRVSSEGADGYTYSQDYTVTFARVPTLSSITVTDQDGTDQAATTAFDGDTVQYTYKVLDSVTSVTIQAEGMDGSYAVTVNGQDASGGVTAAVSGETQVKIAVSANGFTNTYTLDILPGAGKKLSFISDKSVTVEVVNGNGVVMPCSTHKETAAQNRYQYTLVPGETYSYIATKDVYYHIADDFSLEEVADSIITVDFTAMGDWLTDLAFGTRMTNAYKNTLELDSDFAPNVHRYEVTLADTEHNAYIWAASGESGAAINAIYSQVFGSSLYHGKEKAVELTSGNAKGTWLQRFLMDENPIENTLTVRLTKESDGVTYYQDYVVEFRRSLTLAGISAACDGAAVALTRQDGSTGFAAAETEYSVTVSMAAKRLDLAFTRYTENTCYGESEVGYRVLVDEADVTGTDAAAIVLDGTMDTQTVTIRVENDKAPEGSTDYTLKILKSPPVEAAFTVSPEGAVLVLYETVSGERLWPDGGGAYLLCEGYSYTYALTKYGYVGQSGTLGVTRDDSGRLVVTDGTECYAVSESENGGAVRINWSLAAAPANSAINTGLTAQWPDFRGSASNNGVTDAAIPTSAGEGTLYWANHIGSGFDADAVGSPILVDGDLITYAGSTLYRVDTVTGEVKATGTMDHKSSFAITPPTYADGMLFVALSNGTVQAFNAATLESLWVYADPLGGQPNSPLTVKNGYVYTGFWNSETGDANFVCLSVTDEDPDNTGEAKAASWHYTSPGGYYWAGAYVSDDFLLVGTDDGAAGYTSQTSRLLLLDPKTGALLDSWDGLNADVRSTVVYDSATNAYYFTSKGGTFYSVQVSSDRKLTNRWSTALQNGAGGVPMSTCSPVVYNGRAYVGVSGPGQFTPYSGHNITVIDLGSRSIAYCVQTQGYPQTSGLLTTAYEEESGYVYIYFFDNMTPGKLRVLRDKAGQTAADYVTAEGSYMTAYALFTPAGDQAQYAICSPIVDEYGTIYFKNDSAYLMAFGSAIETIEVTAMPDKIVYAEGETFDPAGMVVTATYANGMTRDITAYVSYGTEPLTAEDARFTISFDHVMYHNEETGTAMNAGVPTVTPTAVLELTIGTTALGDVNGDGSVDAADAQMILDHEARNTEGELPLETADVSGDGVIDSNDAVLILQYAKNLISAFPAAAEAASEP